MTVEFAPVEELGNGISRQWLADHQIVKYILNARDRAGVDTWFKAIMDDMQAWPVGQPFMALYDLRGASITPYSLSKSKAFSDSFRPELRGYYASLIDNGPLGIAMRFFANTRYRNTTPVVGAWFFDHQEALAWLMDHLQRHSSNPSVE